MIARCRRRCNRASMRAGRHGGAVHLPTSFARHREALLRARPAAASALAAMLRIMARAFVGARFADLSAQLAGVHGGLASTRHESGGKAADLRAVDVERDAAGELRHVALLQAGGCADIARDGRSEEHTSELQSREKLVCRL